MATVYDINKGINKSVEFKGIKAQYILFLGAGLIGLLLLFAILYVLSKNIYVCLGIILPAGIGLIVTVQNLSKKYGEHGLLKKAAHQKLPSAIICRSRKIFIAINVATNEKA